MDKYKKEIAKILSESTPWSEEEALEKIEVPPTPDMGDLGAPCFSLAKEMKKAPNVIAEEVATIIKGKLSSDMIKEVKVTGPYVNFVLDMATVAKDTLLDIQEKKDSYGRIKCDKKKIMVEFSAPNTNKPQHLGHVRNNLLGQCVSTLLDWSGNDVVRANNVNDRGIHICKSMLAYQKWGEETTPEKEGKKGDHLVGDFYVMFSSEVKEDESLEKEAQELLKKWEDGDKPTIELWKTMNSWVFSGFDETYKRLGIEFDKVYHESETYKGGKDIVLKGVDDGVVEKDDDGALFIDLKESGLDKKYLIRADGTSIYITQDLHLAKLKFDEFGLDKSIYVVASEQIYHFNALFATIKKLGYDWADDCYHLWYGMVNLPEGKMKSREGTVVDADDLMDEMEALAEKEIRARYEDISLEEVDKRKKIIGLGALKFYILRADAGKDMVYDPKESISFEGETGPYVQYAHARICSMLRKHGKEISKDIDFSLLKAEEEKAVLSKLVMFPEIIRSSAEHMRPHILARYLLDLAQDFSHFYHACPCLNEADENLKSARLLLVDSIKIVFANGLNVMGIGAPEAM